MHLWKSNIPWIHTKPCNDLTNGHGMVESFQTSLYAELLAESVAFPAEKDPEEFLTTLNPDTFSRGMDLGS